MGKGRPVGAKEMREKKKQRKWTREGGLTGERGDGANGLKCAPCRVCDGLLLGGTRLMRPAEAETNLKALHSRRGFQRADRVGLPAFHSAHGDGAERQFRP